MIPLADPMLERLDAWWRAANYLSVGQIYLLDNPLLREQLSLDHIKPRLVGHWGTTPGLNFVYAHLNRVIRERDLDAIFVAGPGHGGPGIVANTYLEGTYSELYPTISQDTAGLGRLMKQFSFPGGISSHVGADVPGSIHEGGELGYSLMHAYGAVFDNPDLVVACVVGDGEAETGALATSWHSNKFLNPARDGAVLPILHLNGYKIASPTILARISEDELTRLFRGYGYEPIIVSGDDPFPMHRQMAAALDRALDSISAIQGAARRNGFSERAAWPMIILRSPKGWTGPHTVDGKLTEGTWRSHQVPLSGIADNPAHLEQLQGWLQSYRPDELFDSEGRLLDTIRSLAPSGTRRMSANPHANGGLLLRDLALPALQSYAVRAVDPGTTVAESTRVLGQFLRDVMIANEPHRNFRIFGPDETESNRLSAVFEATDRAFTGQIIETDIQLSPDGRVMEALSEHLCEGWLEGYLLTGRHGVFSSYEAFIHVVDSMFNQHAKWLKVSKEVTWRKPIASLTYLLTSHVWRQDHNGFSHQDPGFIDHVANKKSDIVRVYLPPDANTLLSVMRHCLESRDYVNVVIAGKQPQPQWLDLDSAIAHCRKGAGIWDWASDPGEPDAVLASAGDVPTLEALAAAMILREHFPDIALRFVNVVDLMCLQAPRQHPHGLADDDFTHMFTSTRPVVFAYHGYASLIHRLTYQRRGHENFHVHGYREEGTTTTPFDMAVLNELDRFHLALAVVRRVDRFAPQLAEFERFVEETLTRHSSHIREHGDDLAEIRGWEWSSAVP